MGGRKSNVGVKTDLDPLAIALHAKADDLLKDSPQLALWRPTVGIALQISDTELGLTRVCAEEVGETVWRPPHPPSFAGVEASRMLTPWSGES
jgi:hypothetical protein